MKTLFTFLLLTVATSSFAQDTLSYKSYRSVWSIIPRFGVGDKQTRSVFTTYGSIGLRREFSLGKLISLNATAAYSSVYGRYGNSNLNVLAVGAGVTLYPYYIINLILKRGYDRQQAFKDNFYFDETVEYNLNNTKYGSAGNIPTVRFEFNLGKYNLNKRLFLSPKFGEVYLGETQEPYSSKFDHQGFFYIGAAFGFNPKPKNR
ncbi:hypothetical protein [uncultured Mucilaginibacter sp.]|uniref:hypothetical protein n=1 Tax=uncultured Mucilaginibacter sp. TaxID=797541 RepID=UPI00261E4C9F|nr:hypothetical protein [uncultured Mucilaginibacter sp.]